MVSGSAPAPVANALYQRRWRARQKHPVYAVYQVEFERDAVLQALINRSDVPANEILDRVHRAGAKRRDPGMGGT
jgi:hypothetical protein